MQADREGEVADVVGGELALEARGRALELLDGHHARVVDEHVQRPVPGGDEGADRVEVGQLERRDADIAVDVGGDALAGLGVADGDRYLGAGLRQRAGGLDADARGVLAEHPPGEALSGWMDQVVEYGATKRGMSSALQSVIAAGGNPYSESRVKIAAALATLVDAARDAGAIRRDVDAEDVQRAIGGIWAMPFEPGWEERARTLLGLVMDGLRYGA